MTYEITGNESAKSFDVVCVDPARGSVESDCFQKADWTVADAVETFCSEYGLTHSQVRVEWNMDDVDVLASVTIEQVREMAARDALEAFGESESTQTPDGGWDAWLINGVGGDAVCRLFGESPEENQSGWSSAMAEKLAAYNDAAIEALRAIEA